MRIIELKRRLEEARIPPIIYALDGGLPSEKHCINKVPGINTWEVYYSERGVKSDLIRFTTEDEACDYFYNWILRIAQNMNLE